MLFKKIKWILGVLLIFVLILATNLIDQNNFEKMQGSIESIYEDRLVVKGIIYDMSQEMHAKELAIVTKDTSFYINENAGVNQVIDEKIKTYEKTNLTPEEATEFTKLKENIQTLESLEVGLAGNNWEEQSIILRKVKIIERNLDQLADIQIKEGRREMGSGQRIVSAVNLFTNMEVIGLIVLAIIFQLMIIYTPSKSKSKE